MRTGDTTATERRRIQARLDVLITTPESLYLMLTSQAREPLRSVRWVIIDEIHAMAGSKRGRTSRRPSNASKRSRTSSTADRTVSDPASARGDRALPWRTDLERPASRDDRGRRAPQADGGRGRRAGRGHGGPHGHRRDAAADAADARAGDTGHRAAPGVDLAGDPSPGARADPGPLLDDRVRERPTAGGTSSRPA